MSSKIEDYYLHDAILERIDYKWSQKTVVLELKAFLSGLENPAVKCNLLFYNVQSLSIPHKSPWGDSSQINSVKTENETFHIEMQSGDIIIIYSYSVELEQTHLN